MTRSEVLEKITEICTDVLGCSESAVIETASFSEDLGADSLDVVELVMAFEEAFETSIPDEKIEEIKTVGQAADYFAS